MKNIALIVLSTISISLSIFCIILMVQLKKTSKNLAKLFIDSAVMQEYIDILKSQKDNEILSDELVDKENFIKFLSDSRDWAFSYIENVQNGLTKFVNSVDSKILYFDEYGDVLSENRPDYDAMKIISKAYKELKILLPEEGQ
jgi:uncharacterized protein YoxC